VLNPGERVMYAFTFTMQAGRCKLKGSRRVCASLNESWIKWFAAPIAVSERASLLRA
jgi:hypothetical protein